LYITITYHLSIALSWAPWDLHTTMSGGSDSGGLEYVYLTVKNKKS